MRLETLPEEFFQALPVLERLSEAGFEAYFVGGSVRDSLLGRPIHDVDIATSAYPQEVKQVFKNTIDLGIDHGTVLVLTKGGKYEVTTFRTESDYTDYRRPDRVDFIRDLAEDLKRRDFTINALAMDKDGDITDLFQGLTDLESKKIRAVGLADHRFTEDALRTLRAVRFSGVLGFEIEEETFGAVARHAHLLEKISIERSFVELDKLLLAEGWKLGLDYLNRAGLFRYLPGLGKISLDLLTDTFFFESSAQAWTWLCLQFDQLNLKDWKVANSLIKEVTNLLLAYQEKEWTLENIYRYGAGRAQLVDHLKVGQGQSISKISPWAVDQLLQIHHKSEIAIKGSDLLSAGYKPGPDLGRILSKIEKKIVNNQLENKRETIMEAIATF